MRTAKGKGMMSAVPPFLARKFDSVVAERFPGAVDEMRFAADLAIELRRDGFDTANTLAVISLCRDELTRPLRRLLQDRWGDDFDLSGLAGFPAGGTTALRAARSHAPNRHGPPRLLLFAASHIAIGADGELGASQRPYSRGHSVACGALSALIAEQGKGVDHPDDREMGALRRVIGRAAAAPGADLASLAVLTAELAGKQLVRLAEAVIEDPEARLRVVTGVQIHGPGGRGLFWRGSPVQPG
jgi:hypothetical protein